MKYEVKFEIYGKKMKAYVEALSREDAEYLVRGKIKFHSIREQENEPSLEYLRQMMGMS